jgi:hypothetical protein
MGPYEAPGMSCRPVGYPITDFSTLAYYGSSLSQLTAIRMFTKGFAFWIPMGDTQLGPTT